MRKIAYDEKPKGTGNTQTHLATDEIMNETYDARRMEEGFAASDGVRGETAETGGRVKHPENEDDSIPSREPGSIRDENSGLADN